MENIIYNELRLRGFNVDTGSVETWTVNADGKSMRQKLEVDFVVNKGAEKIYIQSAFKMPVEEKKQQEEKPLLCITDSFKKIIIVSDNIKRKIDENGIITVSLIDFLLDDDII